ncbi:hypothetical protein IH979_01470 [Patescibacteria group bacterium]|nr:hypothetical protein [Patescibacteria group bacterium]
MYTKDGLRETSGNGYNEKQRQSVSVVLLVCGDHRLHHWHSRKAMQEDGINPLGVKLGLIEQGQTLRFDCEAVPGPVVPFSAKHTSQSILRERVVIAQHIDKYASQLKRGEQVFVSTHWHCGRIGEEGGNRDRSMLLCGMHDSIPPLQDQLPNQKIKGAILFLVDDNECVAAEHFTLDELNAEIERIKEELNDISAQDRTPAHF